MVRRLHSAPGAPTFTFMRLSKTLRRLVACAGAVLFLGCHSVGIVYATASSVAQPGAAQESCHHPGQQTDAAAGQDIQHTSCQYQNASSSPSGAGVFAATGLPAITVRMAPVTANDGSKFPAASPLLRIEPPPLAILHCCLRN